LRCVIQEHQICDCNGTIFRAQVWPPGDMRGGGAWWKGGRAEGKCGWARCQGGREYSQLRHVHPSALPPAESLFPHSPRSPPPPPAMTAGAPPRSRCNTLGHGSASALAGSLAQLGGLQYLNSVGPGGVACSAGRPVVPEPRRRRASQGEQDLSRYYIDYCNY
jgi:hypothetical protein